MSVDNSELVAFAAAIQALKDDVPDILDSLAVGEGMYARDQARKICKQDGIVNTGAYRLNFKCGKKAIRHGKAYKIDVFNNLDYAKHLEYGFRGHFVPGHWDGSSFVYQPKDPEGGMYVKFNPGHFVLRRAIKRTKTTQAARLDRKMNRIIQNRLQ